MAYAHSGVRMSDPFQNHQSVAGSDAGYGHMPLSHEDPEMVDLSSSRPVGGSSAYWQPGPDGPSARHSAGGSAFGASSPYLEDESVYGRTPWYRRRAAVLGLIAVALAAAAVALGVGLGIGLKKRNSGNAAADRLSSTMSRSSGGPRTSLSTFTSVTTISGSSVPVVVTTAPPQTSTTPSPTTRRTSSLASSTSSSVANTSPTSSAAATTSDASSSSSTSTSAPSTTRTSATTSSNDNNGGNDGGGLGGVLSSILTTRPIINPGGFTIGIFTGYIPITLAIG